MTDASTAPILQTEITNEPVRQLSLGGRIATFLGIIVPFSGVVTAGVLLWGWGFYWSDLVLMLGMYLLTLSGITVGYHRLFVHRSFETSTWMKFIFGVLGSMALQGNLLKWVALHRRHHQHSDTHDDVHSPNTSGSGVLGFLTGFWHAHVGWAFKADPMNLEHYVKDLSSSRAIRTVSMLFPLWVVIGFVIPAILGGLISGSWMGVVTGLIWGGLVRIFLVHHVTWSVNSACHIWGLQPFRSNDHSKNNVTFGILALGEGWHNNHHAFPTSARHGLRWWQIDVSYWVIRTLAMLGLAWNLKLPTQEMQRQKSKFQ